MAVTIHRQELHLFSFAVWPIGVVRLGRGDLSPGFLARGLDGHGALSMIGRGRVDGGFALGRVDGFDQDEGGGESEEGREVPLGLFAA